MAITTTGDLKPFENQIRAGYIDELSRVANIFNAGSMGAIRFRDYDAAGTLTKESYLKDFGTHSRRDPSSTSSQIAEKIERAEHTMFRTFHKFNRVEFIDEAFNTADNKGVDYVYFLIGQRLAKVKLLASIGQAINVGAAAIESGGTGAGSAGTVLDLTSPTEKNFTQSQINYARLKWGDRMSELRCMVMHSSAFLVLSQNQLLNEKYDVGAGMVLYGGTPGTLGMPIVVTDNEHLMYTEDDKIYYKTLILTLDAIVVGDGNNANPGTTGSVHAHAATEGGKENLISGFQAEWSMWNQVKGYQLKSTASPSENPSDAVLANPLSWEKWVAEKRNTAGILVKAPADLDAVKQIVYVKMES